MVKLVFQGIVALAVLAAGSSLISGARADSLQPSSVFALQESAALGLFGTALLAISRAAARVPASGYSRRASRDLLPASQFPLAPEVVSRPARGSVAIEAAPLGRGNVERAA